MCVSGGRNVGLGATQLGVLNEQAVNVSAVNTGPVSLLQKCAAATQI